MRPLGRWKRRVLDDRGFTIVEVGVAAFVLAIGVTTVVGSMGAGMGLVGHSRQRTTGAGVAQERLERARNIAYDDLALNEDPTFNPDATHPDHKVNEGPLTGPEDDTYRLDDGTSEPLIIDTADGGLKHLDDPFTLANTDFTVHQYVTAANGTPDLNGDAAVPDYKRVTVVVTWKFPVHTGPRHTVTESTFVTDGTVAIPMPSATTTPTAPPPPIGGGGGDESQLGAVVSVGALSGTLPPPSGGVTSCATDTTPPQIQSGDLLSGSGTDQGYLNSAAVQLRLQATDPECHPLTLYMASKPTRSGCTDAAGYSEVQQLEGGAIPVVTVTWTIPSGDGLKALCAVTRNKAGVVSGVWGVSVKLDLTKPTVPGNFRQASCNVSDNSRTATFNWDASTDTNLFGYRLYRSIESGPFALTNQTTSLAVTDVSPKNYASVRYLIRSYDRAGNESNDSSQISYAKNQC
jgi:type II secretory pathway pseudopilin PulG